MNIVRATMQALATVLGGVQSLALSCYDEALALPTEEAQRIAVRTQQVIAFESGAGDSIDGVRRGTPADLWKMASDSANTLVVATN